MLMLAMSERGGQNGEKETYPRCPCQRLSCIVRVRWGAMAKLMVSKKGWRRKEEVKKRIWRAKWRLCSLFKPRLVDKFTFQKLFGFEPQIFVLFLTIEMDNYT
jgi:hypothetical protein